MRYFKQKIENYLLRKKEKIWIKDLMLVLSYLEKEEVRYWIDGGNLLALVRNKMLLPHSKDSDIDLSMEWNRDQYIKMKNLRNYMIDKGMEVEVTYFGVVIKKYRYGRLALRFFNLLAKMSVDLHFFVYTPINISYFRKSGDFYWNTWLNEPGNDYVPRVVPEHLYKELSKITYKEIQLPVPKKYEEYLAYKYGDDWKEKKSNWIYYEDDGTIDKSWVDKKEYQNW